MISHVTSTWELRDHCSVLEAREAMGSTGIGDGIAIPHVRNPILLHVTAPFVNLCLLRDPVDFDAVDGKPVHALFTVVSANVPGHLRILGQLGFVLHDEGLRRLLVDRKSTRLNSSHQLISYAVFCLKKKKK